MNPMPELDALLAKAVDKKMFGTKMRSVILSASDPDAIQAVVDQQFEIGKQIIAAGLCPILEPEVDIHASDKTEIERLLRDAMIKGLDALPDTSNVMIKLSLPSVDNFYKPLVEHPRCVRLVALSGGYSREEANALLSKQKGMIASFSRALAEGLTYEQSQEDFDKTIAASVDSIFEASKAP
jgi:fructose-bisphosphate aldolase class I